MSLGFFHMLLASFFITQGVVQLVFSRENVTIPVLNTKANDTPWKSSTEYQSEELFRIQMMPFVSSFMLITGAFHVLYAFLCFVEMNDNVPAVRWAEYSVTSTIMVLAIGMMSGVSAITSIVSTGACNVTMIFMGYLIDRCIFIENEVLRTSNKRNKKIEFAESNTEESKSLLPISSGDLSHHVACVAYGCFFVGCVAGLGPWVSIFVSLALAGVVPAMVYAITLSICFNYFLFGMHAFVYLYCVFNSSNQQTCLSRFKKWYINNKEPIYMFLSFWTKTQLSWMVYAAFLQV